MAEREMAIPQERREFFRLKFDVPLRFRAYRLPSKSGTAAQAVKPNGRALANGTSQNISRSGILFRTAKTPPQLSSILWMNLDLRTLKICREIEQNALIFNRGLLGKVVRVEEATSDGYQIGVCFLTEDQKNTRAVQKLLTEVAHTTARPSASKSTKRR